MLERLKDEAAVWVFGASRTLTPGESEQVTEAAKEFVRQWTSHRRALSASVEVLEQRFLVVALDDESSGCAIDSLFDFVARLESSLGAKLLDRSLVFFRGSDGNIHSVDRPAFREMAKRGDVTLDTEVFNPAVASGEEMRKGWTMPARESWHKQYFG